MTAHKVNLDNADYSQWVILLRTYEEFVERVEGFLYDKAQEIEDEVSNLDPRIQEEVYSDVYSSYMKVYPEMFRAAVFVTLSGMLERLVIQVSVRRGFFNMNDERKLNDRGYYSLMKKCAKLTGGELDVSLIEDIKAYREIRHCIAHRHNSLPQISRFDVDLSDSNLMRRLAYHVSEQSMEIRLGEHFLRLFVSHIKELKRRFFSLSGRLHE